MEVLKTAFIQLLSLLQTNINILGYNVTLWNIFLFFALGSIVVFFLRGIFK